MEERMPKKIIKILFSSELWYGLFLFSLGSVIIYDSRTGIILDTLYMIDGYKVEAYVVNSKYYDESTYRVELVDIKGRKYAISAVSGEHATKKYRELNKIGAHNVIRRSKFLDKWNYWQRGELTWKVVLTDLTIIFFCIGVYMLTIVLPIIRMLDPILFRKIELRMGVKLLD